MQKVIYWLADQRLQWLLLSDDNRKKQSGSMFLHEEDIKLPDCILNTRHQMLLLPGSDVGLTVIHFGAEEKRHILKTIPYQLEEILPVDIDALIIITGKPEKTSVQVAYADKAKIHQHLETVRAIGLKPTLMIPEQVAFKDFISEQTWLQSGDRLLLKSHSKVLALTKNELTILLNDSDLSLPENILLLTESDNPPLIENEDIQLSMPEDFSSLENSHNFLIGDFVDNQQWLKLFRLAKPVAIAAAIVAVLFTSILLVEKSQLKAKNVELRRDIEQQFRTVQSKGSIYQPKKQMQKLLAAYGASQSQGFSDVFSALAKPFSQQADLEIQSISYDEKNSELRIEMLLKDFPALERLQKDISANALSVELQNSSAQDDKLKVRLKLRRAS